MGGPDCPVCGSLHHLPPILSTMEQKRSNKMARITKAIERKFFLPNDPDKAWVMIKNLSPGEISDISEKVNVQTMTFKKSKSIDPNQTKAKDVFEPELSAKTNPSLDRELTFEKAITGWGNWELENGKKASFSHANVMLFSREFDGFNEFISESRETLTKGIEQEKEDQLKNLPKSASEGVK